MRHLRVGHERPVAASDERFYDLSAVVEGKIEGLGRRRNTVQRTVVRNAA